MHTVGIPFLTMKLHADRVSHLKGSFSHVKTPDLDVPEAQRDPRVVATVSEMLSTIEREGLDAVRRYARDLDRWDDRDFELGATDIDRAVAALAPDLRAALELGCDRTRAFAELQRKHLKGFEEELLPGLAVGQRYVPVGRVGAYLPAGRFPLLASASMTVNVAKVAGVPSVLACTPPQFDGHPDPGVLYAAHIAGAMTPSVRLAI